MVAIPKGELLMERNSHICCQKESFVRNFKALFNQKDPILLGKNEVFQFKINDELDVIKKIQ